MRRLGCLLTLVGVTEVRLLSQQGPTFDVREDKPWDFLIGRLKDHGPSFDDGGCPTLNAVLPEVLAPQSEFAYQRLFVLYKLSQPPESTVVLNFILSPVLAH